MTYEQIDPALAFVSSHYKTRLPELEEQLGSADKERARVLVREVWRLRKALLDFEEHQGATEQSEQAVQWLETLLSRGLGLTGGSREELEQSVPLLGAARPAGEACEFHEYLRRLDKLGETPPPQQPIADPRYEQWLVHATKAQDKLFAYLEFLVARIPRDFRGSSKSSTPGNRSPGWLFLLRDCLLVYLGMRILEREGLVPHTHPTLVGRDLIRSFADNPLDELCYLQLVNSFYQRLSQGPARPVDLVAEFRKTIAEDAAGVVSEAAMELTKLLSAELAGHEYVVVESGAHGTVPLLLMAILPQIQGFFMYTAQPWLHELYGDVLFSRESSELREIEALISQEHLFAFDRVEGGQIWVREVDDGFVRELAYREIAMFTDRVRRKFLGGAL